MPTSSFAPTVPIHATVRPFEDSKDFALILSIILVLLVCFYCICISTCCKNKKCCAFARKENEQNVGFWQPDIFYAENIQRNRYNNIDGILVPSGQEIALGYVSENFVIVPMELDVGALPLPTYEEVQTRSDLGKPPPYSVS